MEKTIAIVKRMFQTKQLISMDSEDGLQYIEEEIPKSTDGKFDAFLSNRTALFDKLIQ